MLTYNEYLVESNKILPNAGLYVHQFFTNGLAPANGLEIYAFDVPVKDGKPDFESIPAGKERDRYIRAWTKQKNNLLIQTGDLKIGKADNLDPRIASYWGAISLDKMQTTRIHMANITKADLGKIEKLSNALIPKSVFLKGAGRKTEFIDGTKYTYDKVFNAAVAAYKQYMMKHKPDMYEEPSLWSHQARRADQTKIDPRDKFTARQNAKR